jgi:hypothetical protein
MPNVSPSFYNKLLEVANELGMKPEMLLGVMAMESGVNPHAGVGQHTAAGLIQFEPSTLKGLGFNGTQDDFRNTDAIKQLDYVKKFVAGNMRYNGGPFKSLAQYYVSNFVPVALKLLGVQNEDPNTILVAKNPTEPHLPGVDMKTEASYYKSNRVLDVDNDGFITYKDIQATMARTVGGKDYLQALNEMKNATGYTAQQPVNGPTNIDQKPTLNEKAVAINDRLNKFLAYFS